ncbi:macro domain-containing protein [Legionella geestiana]|uniref:macro domain-containing protein n=1 Tax=Legionella geestiana TaxID=45065 RepID=UPI001041BC6D|nr:macro domain-containing protein [Legionella geestiana]
MWVTLISTVLYVVYKVTEPLKILINLRGAGTELNIYFGNIFSKNEKSHLAIPVNEFFDTQLAGAKGPSGDIVAPNSIHGQFITKVYNSDSVKLDDDLNVALSGIVPNDLPRYLGKTSQYPIGTTAVIGSGKYRYLLFVLSCTDPITAKAKSDVPTMWNALEGLWTSVRNYSNGLPVALPLVGSGQSHVGLDSINLLRLIVLSIIKSSEGQRITSQINIVLHESVMRDVALRKIKEEFN